MSDAHGRDHVTKIELALDADGKFLAVRTDTLANMGAYLSTFATSIPTYLHGTLMAGPVRDPADLRERAGGLHQHRAGRRLPRRRAAGGDLPARAGDRQGGARDGHRPGRDAAARTSSSRTSSRTRRRSRCIYDTGNYHATLDKLLEIADFAGFAARRAESEAARQAARLGALDLDRGLRHRALEPGRRARRPRRALRERDGAGERHRLDLGLHRHAQPRPGPRDHLPAGGRRACSASTRARSTSCTATPGAIPFGMGTYGSRSIAVGGSAMVQGDREDDRQGQEVSRRT